MNRIVNPVLRAVLRSPVAGLASGRVALILDIDVIVVAVPESLRMRIREAQKDQYR